MFPFIVTIARSVVIFAVRAAFAGTVPVKPGPVQLNLWAAASPLFTVYVMSQLKQTNSLSEVVELASAPVMLKLEITAE